MIAQWKIAALGALGGAVIAVAIVFGAAAFGLLPQKSRIDGPQLRAYLVTHPAILSDMMSRLSDQQADAEDAAEHARQAAVREIGLKSFFDPKVAFVTGPANAKATLVEFFDYNCVHCRNTFPVLRAFYETHKASVRFAFIDFPIFGAMSDAAARAAVAARQQPDKYVAFSFAMMGEKGAIDIDTMYTDARAAGLDMPKLIADMKDPAVGQTLDAVHALARHAGFDGTPTFIINGKVHTGEIDADTLNQLTRS